MSLSWVVKPVCVFVCFVNHLLASPATPRNFSSSVSFTSQPCLVGTGVLQGSFHSTPLFTTLVLTLSSVNASISTVLMMKTSLIATAQFSTTTLFIYKIQTLVRH